MRRLLYILLSSLFPFASAGAQGIAVDSLPAVDYGVEMELAEPFIEISDSLAAVDSVYLDSVLSTSLSHIPEALDSRSIYCHPYSTSYNIPDWKRMWTNTAVLGGAYVGTLLVLQCLPADATSWNRAEITEVPLFKRWYRNVFKLGPDWDHDNPVFNFVLHPYAGAVYFMAARSCGFNFWRSMLYSACVSTVGWEFGVEAFMERPSIQDIFITPLIGSAIGEVFYKTKRSIVDNDYRLLGSRLIGNVAVFLLDPVNELVDIFRGRNTRCPRLSEDGELTYVPREGGVESTLSPVITDSYNGFSLTVRF